jgi:endonuclease-3
MRLPGVGAKTANCVMVYGFGKKAIPVDTHVHRICNRIGLIRTRTPEESERELWKVIPDTFVLNVNDLMVKHGQTICRPISPLCSQCPVSELCEHQPKSA